MKFARIFNGDSLKVDGLGNCYGFRIDKGEWVLYSEQNYNRMRENELKQRQTKLQKQKEKIWKILNNNYELQEALKYELQDDEESDE